MASRRRPSGSRRRGPRSIWWATWPGALGLGLVSFVLVQVGVVPAALFAVMTPDPSSGTDMTIEAPSSAPRIISAVAALVFLALPVLTVIFARRKWLGWLLVALAASFAVMCWGLFQLNVL